MLENNLLGYLSTAAQAHQESVIIPGRIAVLMQSQCAAPKHANRHIQQENRSGGQPTG